jgi:hypothetical protein
MIGANVFSGDFVINFKQKSKNPSNCFDKSKK